MKSPAVSSVNSQFWIWGLVALLILAHQDNWLWNNDWLVFGFLPIGLFYHACLSIVASVFWLVAIRVAWPGGVDEASDAAPTESGGTAE
ncbi:MAG: DUF3311 domain-containing protein [Pirellulaceae bacterium]